MARATGALPRLSREDFRLTQEDVVELKEILEQGFRVQLTEEEAWKIRLVPESVEKLEVLRITWLPEAIHR